MIGTISSFGFRITFILPPFKMLNNGRTAFIGDIFKFVRGHIILMVLFVNLIFIQRHLDANIFIISSNMKTSEIKNFAVHGTIRNTKLKFNETKSEIGDQYFTLDDKKKVSMVCKSLKEAKQENKPINPMILELDYQLMLKLSKYIDHKLSQNLKNDVNNIKFRVVRSAKKINPNSDKLEDPSASQHWERKPIKLKPLVIIENKSQFFNKENLNHQIDPYPSGVSIEFVKEKKYTQFFTTPKKKFCEQQRDRFKSQLNTEQRVQNQLQTARQTVDQKNQENRKLRKMLLQMQNKKNQGQTLSASLKISLQYEQTIASSQPPQKLKVPVPQIKTSNSQNLSPCIFHNEEISHLQLISVCQHKQIENLQQKLIEEQTKSKNAPACKKQRWNNL